MIEASLILSNVLDYAITRQINRHWQVGIILTGMEGFYLIYYYGRGNKILSILMVDPSL